MFPNSRSHIWFLLCANLILWTQGETIRRRTEETCDYPPTKGLTYSFTEEFVTQIIKASNVSDMAYDVYPPIRNIPKLAIDESGFDTLESWLDIDDAAIVARHGNTCYGAFRGTMGLNPLDLAQLFDPISRPFHSCQVRLGFWRAYNLSFFQKEFRDAIHRCMQVGSELVLTGHSQGGSIAVVASIDFQQYNPTVITFGSVRALREPCGEIDSSRHFRFINTGDQVYDEWANGFSLFGVHVGQAFLLDATSTNPGVYLGGDDDSTRTPKDRDAHNRDLYWAALDNAFGEGTCFPVQFGGWEEGHWCTRDDECTSRACRDGFCAEFEPTLAGGSPCSVDSDCPSGVCERSGYLFWTKRRCST